MKTVCCRICLKFFKKRRIGRSLEWCGECRQLVCTAHITDVVHKEPKRNPYGLPPKEIHTRTCKLCLAERALVTA
jgi:hypothetical protein